MKVDIEHMPISLDHDGLKDAVVCIRYISDYNVRFVSKTILSAINSDNNNFEEIPTKDTSVVNDSMSYKDSNDKILLANPIYRIQISERDIALNFTNNYPGWNDYSKLIETVLTAINQVELQGVSLHYLSGFENTDIFRALDGTIKLNQLPIFQGSVFNFSCSCNDGDESIAEAKIKLTNNIQIQNSKISIVEITIAGKAGHYSQKECMSLLTKCHNFEKHLFFLLLSEEFINILGPRYE